MKMKVVNLSSTPKKEVLTQTTSVLTNGGLMVYPTETCYGLGVDATNIGAIRKLLAFKGGRKNNPISIAVSSEEMAKEYVEVNEMAKNLYSTLLPGPITVVSKCKGKTATQLASDNNTLGIRIPNYPLTREVIAHFGKPITATSANTSGKKQPYSLNDLKRYTSSKRREMIDLFLDAGELPERQPSTVVDTTLNELAVIRQGTVRVDGLQAESVTTESVQETRALAEKLMKRYMKTLETEPVVWSLQGELGAGKTQLVKGLAKALGITENVPSPTYTLMREYPYQMKDIEGKLYHIDTWRMESAEDFEVLEVDKRLKPGTVIAIEWLQKVKPQIQAMANKATVIWVDIKDISETSRVIRYWEE